jgi:hypothetical protein
MHAFTKAPAVQAGDSDDSRRERSGASSEVRAKRGALVGVHAASQTGSGTRDPGSGNRGSGFVARDSGFGAANAASAPPSRLASGGLALSELLEARLGRRVELVTIEALSPFLVRESWPKRKMSFEQPD